jgi:hypothetical protein
MRHAETNLQDRAILSGSGKHYAAPPPQSHGGSGGMRMLFRRNPWRPSAEDFEASRLPSKRGHRVCAARRKVDALSHRDASASWGLAESEADPWLAQGRKGHAERRRTLDQGLLLPLKIPSARRRSAPHDGSGFLLRALLMSTALSTQGRNCSPAAQKKLSFLDRFLTLWIFLVAFWMRHRYFGSPSDSLSQEPLTDL